MQLNIEYVPLSEITPYTRNAKRHPAKQIDQIKESIKQFGFNDPIALWHGEIVEGNGRYAAAQAMGLEKVPVIRLDELTDEQRRAYALVHNKSAEFSDWLTDVVKTELDDISLDMAGFGFDLKGEEEKEKPEIEFTTILGEENNYIVLKFNTDIDWLQVETLFGLEPVKAYSTRKDGKVTKTMQRVGVGRVVDGVEFLNRIGVDL